MTIRIPLDGLGMDEKAMLELVNRLNQNDDRKWTFHRGSCGYSQMMNPYCGLPYSAQASNVLQ